MSAAIDGQTAASEAPVPAAPSARPRPGFFGLELLDNRYPVLHGLRVVAILSVIQYHVTWIFTGEQNIELHEGFTDAVLSIFFGMDLFFVLSGFLIGAILLRSLEVSGTQNLRRFYLRRIFRTFPSYYVVLTALALWLPLTAAQRTHLPFEYVYLTNFMPLARDQIIMFWGWSLALEEQFYLAVPLLMFLLFRLRTDRARMIALAILIVLALGIRIGVYLRGAPWTDFALYEAVYFRTYTRFDPIIAGILLAFIELRHGERIAAWLRHPFHRALLGGLALLCLWLVTTPDLFGEDNTHPMRLLCWGTLTSVMYLAALPLFLHGDGVVHRFLSRPIFRKLATVGYGVYLIHIPIIDHVLVPIAHRLEAAEASMLWVWPLAMLSVTVSSFALGYLLHVFVEKPSLRLRDRFAA